MRTYQAFLFFMLTTGSALAVPALSVEREYTQPDKTTFTGTLKGDEHFNWVDLGAGLIAVYNNKSKYFEYAEVNSLGFIASTGVYVQDSLHSSLLTAEGKKTAARETNASDSSTAEPTETSVEGTDSEGTIVIIKPVKKDSIKQWAAYKRAASAPKPHIIYINQPD